MFFLFEMGTSYDCILKPETTIINDSASSSAILAMLVNAMAFARISPILFFIFSVLRFLLKYIILSGNQSNGV